MLEYIPRVQHLVSSPEPFMFFLKVPVLINSSIPGAHLCTIHPLSALELEY